MVVVQLLASLVRDQPPADVPGATQSRPTVSAGAVRVMFMWCGVAKLARSVPTVSASVGDSHTPCTHPWCEASNMASRRAVCSRLCGSQVPIRRSPSVIHQESRSVAERDLPVTSGCWLAPAEVEEVSRPVSVRCRSQPESHLRGARNEGVEWGAIVTSGSIARNASNAPPDACSPCATHPVWPKLGDYVRDFDDAQRPALLACWLWEMICNRAEGAVAFEYIRHV